MKISIVTPFNRLATELGSQMEQAGYAETKAWTDHKGYAIRYGSAVASADLHEILTIIRPFSPPLQVDASLDREEVVIELAPTQDLDSYELKLYSDSNAMLGRLVDDCSHLGFQIDESKQGFLETDSIVHGDLDPFAVQLIKWLGTGYGVDLKARKEWHVSDNGMTIFVGDPECTRLTPEERFRIRVMTDDQAEGGKLSERLIRDGFSSVEVMPLTKEAPKVFNLDSGPLLSTQFAPIRSRLMSSLYAEMEAQEVDLHGYPLNTEAEDDIEEGVENFITIQWPMGEATAGTLRPYAGDRRDRFLIIVRTDDKQAGEQLVNALQAAGFSNTRVRHAPRMDTDFTVELRNARDAHRTCEALLAVLEDVQQKLSIPEPFQFVHDRDAKDPFTPESKGDDIEVSLPIDSAREGHLRAILESGSGFNLKLQGKNLEDWTDLKEELDQWEFSKVETDTIPMDSQTKIRCGGAPTPLINRLMHTLETRFGITAPIVERCWPFSDHDIFVQLPQRRQGDAPEISEHSQQEPGLAGFYPGHEVVGSEFGFIDQQASRVQVGSVTLARNQHSHPMAPSMDAFRHYCVDQSTAETLEFVAQSVSMSEPCLLEGETATSKTSAITYLAALTGQPVLRLNLNGQTDAGELIGRFVPGNSGQEMPSFDELDQVHPWLEPVSREILAQAQEQNRALTRLEIEKIMALEGFQRQSWQWLEGAVVMAMKNGWWLILDEINLAEPQILERLNAVVEQPPSLVVSENNNEVIGPSGTPVHPGFRLFATMNPAEYAGRAVMSPAYRDRWLAHRYVSAPQQSDYAAMLKQLVLGYQPEVTVRGVHYLGGSEMPLFPQLAKLPQIELLLERLADFHAGVASTEEQSVAESASPLGEGRRENHVFSRRTLLSVLGYAANNLHLGDRDPHEPIKRALERYYLAGIANARDHDAMIGYLDAVGLGPNCWLPTRSEC